jgi:dihydroorotate dehydrogenase electron transfer subunit
LRHISATVLSNRRLLRYPGATYFLMRIQAPEIAPICKPGQFLMLKCGKDALLRRPISIHSVIESTCLELLYALPCKIHDKSYPTDLARETEPQTAIGAGTRWLSKLKKGYQLDLIGPLGNGFTIESSAKNLLLIAGGIGIAPLRFLADTGISMGKNVTMLLGARYRKGHFPDKELPAHVRIIRTIEQGIQSRKYRKGTITEIVPEYIDWADQVFACGPKAMYQALDKQMRTYPRERNVQVSLEVRMGCGTGICYSCSIKTQQGMKRVCKEGPVYNIRDIIWQEVVT